jgi:hypothetical protein
VSRAGPSIGILLVAMLLVGCVADRVAEVGLGCAENEPVETTAGVRGHPPEKLDWLDRYIVRRLVVGIGLSRGEIEFVATSGTGGRTLFFEADRLVGWGNMLSNDFVWTPGDAFVLEASWDEVSFLARPGFRVKATVDLPPQADPIRHSSYCIVRCGSAPLWVLGTRPLVLIEGVPPSIAGTLFRTNSKGHPWLGLGYDASTGSVVALAEDGALVAFDLEARKQSGETMVPGRTFESGNLCTVGGEAWVGTGGNEIFRVSLPSMAPLPGLRANCERLSEFAAFEEEGIVATVGWRRIDERTDHQAFIAVVDLWRHGVLMATSEFKAEGLIGSVTWSKETRTLYVGSRSVHRIAYDW